MKEIRKLLFAVLGAIPLIILIVGWVGFSTPERGGLLRSLAFWLVFWVFIDVYHWIRGLA